MSKRGQRYHLTQAQLRRLTLAERPDIDPTGKTRLVPNTKGKPYRFLLSMGGSNVSGFGVYVGKTKTTYEVQVGTGTSTKREALGSVMELTIEEAFRRAVDTRQAIRGGGDSPKRAEKTHAHALEVRSITVEECLARYIDYLSQRVVNGDRKPVSVTAVRLSLARIQRPEVGLANVQVRDLLIDEAGGVEGAKTTPRIIQAWNACRTSCMELSNQLTTEQKKTLRGMGEWWRHDAGAMEAAGFKGRYIQKALSSGLAATEHTFGDIKRAIDLVIEEEAQQAVLQKRAPELSINPTKILFKRGYFRDHTKLRAHYRKAQVRNPLGEAEGDQSLQLAMKALIGRRQHYLDAHQKVGVDYLFIVLLWALRRNEGTILRWYEDCTPGELLQETRSWVWLAPNPQERNPTTRQTGSQAFLHDTKTGTVQHIPIAYFAERILRMRWDDRLDTVENYPQRLAKAKAELAAAEARTYDEMKLAIYRKAIRRIEFQRKNVGWVFPARSIKAKEGHYKDSKSLLQYLRVDTGRLDLARDIDQGLTLHDFRRTLGRFASKHLSGRMVSELLKHFNSHGTDGEDKMSSTTAKYYSDQEWDDVRGAMAQVEEAMIRTSPRVWNYLKGADKPMLDEANDPPIQLSWRSLKNQDEEE
ncbi:integrase [Luteimonas sp. MC1750]|uniref:integrase n=1 Tax=Luteimonas sp. MC1750 TaxID=2799326 RepID=UPI0018F0D9CC|nr:integrase [Luteimonas sp. MC1750]MBJ6983961.1 integrase [Luteimonas sp. MC1750]QQO06774.1 integrase [Luteimonas sp. MC1750]